MFRWVDHTAEVELEIEAPDEDGVFRDALAAFAELTGPPTAGADEERRHVSLAAPDRATLLAEWVQELAFLAETQGFEPAGVAALTLGPGGLEATVAGRIGDPPHLVKAVTYHRLEFEGTASGYSARLVLDV